MPLIINGLRAGTHTQMQTHTHTRILMCEEKKFQETRCAQFLVMHAWFKQTLTVQLENLDQLSNIKPISVDMLNKPKVLWLQNHCHMANRYANKTQ